MRQGVVLTAITVWMCGLWEILDGRIKWKFPGKATGRGGGEGEGDVVGGRRRRERWRLRG